MALQLVEGLIGSIIALLGLDLAPPDHTTLSRRGEGLDVVRPRQGSGPVHLLVDSRELKLCGSGESLLAKHGTKTRRSWRKLHIAVDADTGQIAAAALTTSDVDDASQVGRLLEQVDSAAESFGRRRLATTWRALVKADISRFKRVIGHGLRSRTDRRRATEVEIAVNALNRMLKLGRPQYVRLS